jgi:molybdopterin molybdotransferase
MISVNEAKGIISASVRPLHPRKLSLNDAFDTVLAENIYAPYDIPAFPQSSMDGYAIAYSDLEKRNDFSVSGESAAGSTREFGITERTAARIFTGAAVPAGADTVVMQEKIRLNDGKITVEDDALIRGSNVRSKGSEIARGELALPQDAYLSAAAIGFLANIGVTNVSVYAKPVVGIILTGNELVSPGKPLKYGEVYESNSIALKGALRQFHISPEHIREAKDDPAELKQIIQETLLPCDMLLLTGGVSVGDYDYVKSALEECGVKTLFHKIKQRPGKPLFFGMADGKVIFGLPGNPSSVLTCFYEYVVPAIKQLSNGRQAIPVLKAALAEPFRKKIPFTQFVKGYFDGVKVTPLPGQESYKMNSFARANCLVVLTEEDTDCKAGDVKEIHLIT